MSLRKFGAYARPRLQTLGEGEWSSKAARPRGGECHIFSHYGVTRLLLGGKLQCYRQPCRHFSKRGFLENFFSLRSDCFAEQEKLYSRNLFYCAILMSTNNSEANITCRRQGLQIEEQRERERQRARINWQRASEEDRERKRARDRERRRNISEQRREAERVRDRERRRNMSEQQREAERARDRERRRNGSEQYREAERARARENRQKRRKKEREREIQRQRERPQNNNMLTEGK